MKVAVMTWFHYHNYGTALQVFAMSQYLKKVGHNPYIVNYRPDAKQIAVHRDSIIKDVFQEGINRIKEHPYHRYDAIEREELFERFLTSNLDFTKECIILPDFESLNNEFDAFVCGSDQIWSPSVFDSHYYLDFVRDTNKMIAYAPSVGLPRISDEIIKERIKELCSRFVHLSTRESSGSKLINDACGKYVKTVLDPTFLLSKSEWIKYIQSGSNSQPYILVYMLGKNERQWRKIRKIEKKLGIPVKIIPVFYRDLERKGCILEPVGPLQFLSLVNDAAYVCTDSFHGVAFSIIFNKQFVVFERFKENDKLNQNSRIYNILDSLKLKSQIIRCDDDLYLLNKEIDYSKINQLIGALKAESISYLNDALEDVSKHTEKRMFKSNIKNFSSLCCGCGACERICPVNAITVGMDSEGFYTANFNNAECISCAKCLKVCPYLNSTNNISLRQGKLYSYIDNNKNVLAKSSSGGLGFRIAENYLSNGWCVIGSIFDQKNHKAKHILIDHEHNDELELTQGSKYTQSEFASAIGLVKDYTVIFGTPCQIAGARSLYGDTNKIIYVDLICHGVPSYYLYAKYLKYLHEKYSMQTDDLFKTVFRFKEKGWRDRYIYNTDFRKDYCKFQNDDPYFLSFEHGFCYSKSCYECPWRVESAADIRIGDYWHNRYRNNNTGISMAVVLTHKGEEVIHSINHCGSLSEETITDYFECQQIKNNRRPVFWEDMIEELGGDGNMEEIVKKYVIPYEKRKKIRAIIANIKRAVKKNG